ncbi:hypothetical protein BN2476_630021 [Paraburkholderia piptadeniae]|uniref:Uncharacterized protein n=1 Tax=Paraburkholderia piptadeniae TaxID=1701573 RepID=A0A1N7SL51_9BURK|nr:hypothetical protein BN2476_630021 [Paraburkholderia piptadeniae]
MHELDASLQRLGDLASATSNKEKGRETYQRIGLPETGPYERRRRDERLRPPCFPHETAIPLGVERPSRVYFVEKLRFRARAR